ncbi:MAG: hypothetical protein ABIW84_07620, partial [Ilumatobacteraceae bacterium]
MSSKMIRKLIVGVAASLATAVGLSSVAEASHQVSAAPLATNNAIGVVSGTAYVPLDNSYLQVFGYLRDKPDGYYATLQVRPLVTFASTGLSQWKQWTKVV